MTEDQFWQILAETKADDKKLVSHLAKLPVEEIIAFDDHIWHFSNISYNGDLWCAAYVAMGGCSDDGFDYFRGWLITQGKEVFEAALKDPDSLVDVLVALQEEDEGNIPENEDILGVSARAYKKKTRLDNYYALPRTPPSQRPPISFRWQEDSPDSMKAICPRIFARFWEDPF